jgi:nicotinamidase-related amidase
MESKRHDDRGGDDRLLSAADTLVLFGDLQPRTIARETTVPAARLQKFAGALAQLANFYGLPAIITTTNPDPTIPEITSVFPNVQPVQRTIPAAFRNPPLVDAIRDTKRRTILICGVATEVVVQLAALGAVDAGYRAQVVTDVCGGLSARSEEAAFRRLNEAGVVLTSLAGAFGELAGALGDPQTQQAAAAVLGAYAS